jgi:hypothetical protein
MREAIPPLPQYAFMAWCSVKAQGQLYLLPLTVFLPQNQANYGHILQWLCKIRLGAKKDFQTITSTLYQQ